MSARIRIAEVELTVDDELVWEVTELNGTKPSVASALARLLTAGYGLDWLPPFGVYEPSMPNAVARAAAEDLGAEVLELEAESTPQGRPD